MYLDTGKFDMSVGRMHEWKTVEKSCNSDRVIIRRAYRLSVYVATAFCCETWKTNKATGRLFGNLFFLLFNSFLTSACSKRLIVSRDENPPSVLGWFATFRQPIRGRTAAVALRARCVALQQSVGHRDQLRRHRLRDRGQRQERAGRVFAIATTDTPRVGM